MQNDSRTRGIAFALVDKLKSIIFHLLQAHSDRPLTERRAIDHTIKKLFITKCLNVGALVCLENRQIITWSTLVLSEFQRDAASCFA